MKAENVWVIARHEIDYLNSCFLSDEIVAKTWVGQTEGVRSVRHVEIHNKTSGKIAAKVATTWILLDPKTLRPKRISEELKAVFF
jgi:acyl-CoA thioester hydrolase